jgi:hypothetical protein
MEGVDCVPALAGVGQCGGADRIGICRYSRFNCRRIRARRSTNLALPFSLLLRRLNERAAQIDRELGSQSPYAAQGLPEVTGVDANVSAVLSSVGPLALGVPPAER